MFFSFKGHFVDTAHGVHPFHIVDQDRVYCRVDDQAAVDPCLFASHDWAHVRIFSLFVELTKLFFFALRI